MIITLDGKISTTLTNFEYYCLSSFKEISFVTIKFE